MKPIKNLHCIEYLKFNKLTLILFGEIHAESNLADEKLVLNEYIVKFLCKNKLNQFVVYREDFEDIYERQELVGFFLNSFIYFKAHGDGSYIDSVYYNCDGKESILVSRNAFYKFMKHVKRLEPEFVINLFRNMVYYDEKTFEFIRSFLIVEITKKGCCRQDIVKTYFDIRGDLILKLLLKNMANFNKMNEYVTDLEILENNSKNRDILWNIIDKFVVSTPILEIYFIINNDIHMLLERKTHENVILIAGSFHVDFIYEMYRYLDEEAKDDIQLSSFIIQDFFRTGGDIADNKVTEQDLIDLVKYLYTDKKIF